VIRTKDRAAKYYDNLRLVYEIRSRLNEIRDQQEVPAQNETKTKSASGGKEQTAPAGATPEGNSKK